MDVSADALSKSTGLRRDPGTVGHGGVLDVRQTNTPCYSVTFDCL